MDLHSEFFPLLTISVLAFAVPLIATRFRTVRLPIVVGEIIAGVIFGKSGLNYIHATPIINFLAEFGFAFLMFLSGLEMNLDELTTIHRKNHAAPIMQRPIYLSFLSFVITLFISLCIGWGFTYFGLSENTFIMGLILCTTSLGIVVPILKERGITNSPFGQIMLVTALIGDFATLFLLSITIAIISKGPSVEVFFALIIFLVFAIAVKLINHLRNITFLSNAMSQLASATSQIRIRGVFALILIWVVLAQKLGLEIILGAFLAGVIVSFLRPGDEAVLKSKLDAIGYGFFIPIFFVTVGVNFDIHALLESKTALTLVPLFIAAAYFVKVVPALVFYRVFSWRNTLAAGFLLSSRLSLVIAASEIALSLGIFSSATYSAMVLVAVTTCTLSPILFAQLYSSE